MAADQGRMSIEHQRAQRAEHPGAQHVGDQELIGPASLPSSGSSRLGDPRLNGRGSGPMRAALMQQLQRTCGNHAVQRFLRVPPAADAVALTPVVDTGQRLQVEAGNGSALDTRVNGQPEEGRDMSISTPADSVQQVAEQSADRAMSACPLATQRRLIAPPFVPVTRVQRQRASADASTVSVAGWAGKSAEVRRSTVNRPAVQRYQAGEAGHGRLEQAAMQSAGFSAGEAKQIYMGNWLRDFSQLAPKWEKMPEIKPPLMQVLNVLALGEFGREITDADLGTYVASEHLDNPEGTGSIEDPEVQKDPTKVKEAYDKLSPSQKAMYDRVEAEFKAKHAKDTSGLPDYLQRGKIRTKFKLEDAIKAGKTPEGMTMLGDALHTVEDYFSHSNFVSVAIYTLQQEGAAPPSLVENKAKVDAILGADTAMLNAKGRPQIVTGSYATSADAQVSILEALKTALHSDEMSKALTLGIMRKLGITPDQVGRKVGAGVGGAIGGGVGAIAGGVSGGLSGAVGGAAAGWDRNSGLRAVGGAIWGGLSGAATGILEGSSAGEAEGRREGEALGGAAGGGIAGGIAWADKTLDEILDLLGVPAITEFFAEISPAKAALGALLDFVIEKLVADSAEQAKKLGVKGPTHSQISKDAPDNPLFGVSVALATEADKKIGEAVKTAWAAAPAATSTPAPPVAVDTKPVTDLVDTYISMPASDGWWRPILTAAARTAAK